MMSITVKWKTVFRILSKRISGELMLKLNYTTVDVVFQVQLVTLNFIKGHLHLSIIHFFVLFPTHNPKNTFKFVVAFLANCEKGV